MKKDEHNEKVFSPEEIAIAAAIESAAAAAAVGYYKDADGNVHHLDNGSFRHLLPEGLIKISDEEGIALETPKASDVAQQENNKARNFLSSTDWKIQRHTDQLLGKIKPSLSDEELSDLLQKRQAARDSVK